MYYCGWDGGGTKTEVCLLDANGQVLETRSFGPLNPNGTARETVEATAQDCLALMAEYGLSHCAGLVIGIAGVSNADAAGLVEDAVRRGGYTGKLRLLGDQEIALAGAVNGPGAVLIAGTGAVCFGRDAQGNSFRVGGYGYLIDDGGSGYAIGRDLLAAAVRCLDGRLPESCLTPLVLAQLQARDARDIVTWLYAPKTGKKEIASLAPLLLQGLEKQDGVALSIARKAAEDLAELVITAWQKTGMNGGELALMGSILQHYDLIRQGVIRSVQARFPGIAVHDPLGSASLGAARLAMRQAD